MRLGCLYIVIGLWLFLSIPALSQEQTEQTSSTEVAFTDSDTEDLLPTDESSSDDSLAPSMDISVTESPSETSTLPQPTDSSNRVSVPGIPSGITLNDAQQANLRADCNILQTIYLKMNGPNWIKKDGWESQDTSSCCSWYGVSCNNGGRVKGIRLPENGVSGSIPPEIGQLSSLLSLDLSKNQLSSQIPETFGSLTMLISLNFDGSGLGGAISESLGGMISLQSLHLRNNTFTNLPDSFSKLTALRGLFLTNNRFTGNIPPVIFKMPNLEIIALDYNQLQGSISEEIGGMVKLQALYLKHNMLNGSLPQSLSKCTSLRAISLSHNRIQGNIPISYTNLIDLVTLDISHNGLIGTIPSEIGNLKNLERLSLSQNQLVGSIPSSLRELKRLQRLAIHLNALNGIFPGMAAPKNLTFCKVQPNLFNGCPPDDHVRDRTTLAFQCHLDCSPKSINIVTAAGSLVLPIPSYVILIFITLLDHLE